MKLSHQNALNLIQKNSLQLALAITSVTVGVLGVMNLILGMKDPLVIERGCDSKVALIQSAAQSKDEVEDFIRIALASRFDSAVKFDPAIYLTEALQIVRSKEQAELKNKSIDQRVIVRSVRFDHEKYLVEADRLIGIGKVRTAVPLDLTLGISSKIRSVSNPYGLILSGVDQTRGEPNAN